MRRLALAALICTLAAPAGAGARVLHTVLEDDDLALFSAPQTVPGFMRTLSWLGVDYLRVSAEWKIEAPGPNSYHRPPGFAATDPNAYDTPGMRDLDRAVRAAASEGLRVMIDPAFSAPLWATTNQRSLAAGDPWYNANIDLRDLVAWETMLARRYSGHFTPAGQHSPLPEVQAFTLWNEPNGPSFLQPQWRAGVPTSADWYRQLVYLAYPAIKQAATGALVLIGNTSNAGGDVALGSGGVPPLSFIRRLACVDARLRPLSTGPCAHFAPIPGDGYAHHPYERSDPPWTPSGAQRPDWAQMGDIAVLQTLLDKLVSRGRLAPGGADLWLTEQGYESNGELGDRPWSESQQAQLSAASEYLAWREVRAASFSQFLLRDSLTTDTLALRIRTGQPHAAVLGTWTTGLERQDGRPKPALWMFRSPVVARLASAPHPACLVPSLARGAGISSAVLVEIWGRARPLHASSRVTVVVNRSFTRSAWTDAEGIFDLTLALPVGAQVAFRWRGPDESWQASPSTTPIPIPLYSGG